MFYHIANLASQMDAMVNIYKDLFYRVKSINTFHTSVPFQINIRINIVLFFLLFYYLSWLKNIQFCN